MEESKSEKKTHSVQKLSPPPPLVHKENVAVHDAKEKAKPSKPVLLKTIDDYRGGSYSVDPDSDIRVITMLATDNLFTMLPADKSVCNFHIKLPAASQMLGRSIAVYAHGGSPPLRISAAQSLHTIDITNCGNFQFMSRHRFDRHVYEIMCIKGDVYQEDFGDGFVRLTSIGDRWLVEQNRGFVEFQDLYRDSSNKFRHWDRSVCSDTYTTYCKCPGYCGNKPE